MYSLAILITIAISFVYICFIFSSLLPDVASEASIRRPLLAELGLAVQRRALTQLRLTANLTIASSSNSKEREK